jgi:7-carboxy-7-deazaguanine synthase
MSTEQKNTRTESSNRSTPVFYPVMEHFYTLQGEGYFTGQAAYFIRLGGCDVGCVWCDVKESWDAARHPLMSTDTMVELALEHPGRLVVLTGGEPAMHDLGPFCEAFHKAGFQLNLETSGAHPVQGDFDWVTVSPKKFKGPLAENLLLAEELKVVVYHKSDFDWAEEHGALVGASCRLYLQPEWGKRETVTPLIIEYIQKHPRWQLSLQTHKFINIP